RSADRAWHATPRRVAHELQRAAVQGLLAAAPVVPPVDEGRPAMKVALAFGTRPEAIKMAPVITALRSQPGITTEVLLTAQPRVLLDHVLGVLGSRADHDLNVMRPLQSLSELTSRLIAALDEWLAQSRPDLLMVQGDTTSAFIGA